jgi:hypothetical protein
MTRNVVALYDNFEDANAAVRDLVDQGFRREEISFMAADQRTQRGAVTGTDETVTRPRQPRTAPPAPMTLRAPELGQESGQQWAAWQAS